MPLKGGELLVLIQVSSPYKKTQGNSHTTNPVIKHKMGILNLVMYSIC